MSATLTVLPLAALEGAALEPAALGEAAAEDAALEDAALADELLEDELELQAVTSSAATARVLAAAARRRGAGMVLSDPASRTFGRPIVDDEAAVYIWPVYSGDAVPWRGVGRALHPAVKRCVINISFRNGLRNDVRQSLPN